MSIPYILFSDVHAYNSDPGDSASPLKELYSLPMVDKKDSTTFVRYSL